MADSTQNAKSEHSINATLCTKPDTMCSGLHFLCRKHRTASEMSSKPLFK